VRVRVGVVGGGLIAQAMHLPYLQSLDDRFELRALADPSPRVRAVIGARYGIATYADAADLLEAGGIDAALVCTPHALHAPVVIDALDAGVHVFVEKPLCITLADADAIIAARDRAARVVQVGYMKRFDPAYERLLDELPDSSAELRHVAVSVTDPDYMPFFAPGELVRGDVPAEALEAGARAEAEQVRAAVGDVSNSAASAFTGSFLGSLVHDVNLVHGVLERLGEPLPARVVSGAWWDGGRGVAATAELLSGSRWDCAWLALPGVPEYREFHQYAFAGSIRRLTFPSPYLKSSPTLYERVEGTTTTVFRRYEESFRRELQHFHECIAGDAACRTPPEQARLDIDVLTRMFVASIPVPGTLTIK
jgi:predicted dehydrogenase